MSQVNCRANSMRVVALKQTHYQSGKQFHISTRKPDAQRLYLIRHFTCYITSKLQNKLYACRSLKNKPITLQENSFLYQREGLTPAACI